MIDGKKARFRVVLINPEDDDLSRIARPIQTSGGVLEAGKCHGTNEIIAFARGAHGMIIQSLKTDAERVFAALPDLRALGRMGIGLDSIDVAAATRHGIFVVNVPQFCEEEVCDHTMALLLACARRIVQYDRATRRGKWDTKTSGTIYRLRGKTMGLIGFGKIPKLVAIRAKAFGLRVIAYDPHVPMECFGKNGVVAAIMLEDLLAQSDFVSVHCPLTESTRGLINGERLARMKPTAFIINTARGGIVEESALGRAVREGQIAGAALDVLIMEPPEINHPLLSLDNIIVTPHSAYYSEEAIEELHEKIGQYMTEAILKGQSDALVNPEVALFRNAVKSVFCS